MPPQSRINSLYPPTSPVAPNGDTSAKAVVDGMIAMVQEQTREARRLRDAGQYGAAIAGYQRAVRCCGDACRRLGKAPTASGFKKHELLLQKELEELASSGRCHAPVVPPGANNGSSNTMGALARPASGSLSAQGSGSVAELAQGGDVDGVSPSKVGGFRTPKSTLDLEWATWPQYTSLTNKLKDESDKLKATDPAQSAAKLREAADIWNYAATSPRFQMFGDLRKKAREIADRYMLSANSLHPPPGSMQTVDGGTSTKLDVAEIDRQVRDCIITETPQNKIKFDQIVGAKEAKNALLSALFDRYIYKGDVEDETRGVLLYGPGGTGKTMLVRGAVSSVNEMLGKRAARAQEDLLARQKLVESKARENSLDDSNSVATVSENDTQDRVPKSITLIVVSASEVESKYVGDGPKFMRSLFKVAREVQPSVIFIDEADSLFTKRGDGQHEATAKNMTQFMQEMEGIKSTGNITVIAASNTPQKLDDAVLRRLQRSVYVPAPTPADRAIILEQQLKVMNYPFDVPQDKMRELAMSKVMQDFTGSDIKLVLKNAKEEGPEAALHEATAFHEVDGELEPCAPDAPDAVVGNHREVFIVTGTTFRKLPLTYAHIEAVALKHRPNSSKQIPELEKWKKQLEASKL